MQIEQTVQAQHLFFATNTTKNVQWRIAKLKRLKDVILSNKEDILHALKQDLGKTEMEGYMSELGLVISELNFFISHCARWARPKRVHTPLAHFISTSKIYKEPYGVTLIMSPWNYPFLLSIDPLIAAVAAGNCCVLKPSAYSPSTSEIIAKIVAETFKYNHVAVIQGGRSENAALIKQKFDYIFFTGSSSVGKEVMHAAAENLTPISLELGGKSPCIIDQSANIPLAAKRLVWGKYLNAGQTCVAPDYVYVHSSVKSQLISELKQQILLAFGQNPLSNDELPKIVNEKHFLRLNSLLQNQNIIFGGKSDAVTGKIEPTAVSAENWDNPAMQEEIFGPILPILSFDNLQDVIATVKSKDKPLALYLFTNSNLIKSQILSQISYGGGCINDAIIHLATSHMPFGGVGASGMGGYHGKFGFDTFSHLKSVVQKSNIIDINARYHPYSKQKYSLIKMLFK